MTPNPVVTAAEERRRQPGVKVARDCTVTRFSEAVAYSLNVVTQPGVDAADLGLVDGA